MSDYLGDFKSSITRIDDCFTMVTADGTPTAVTTGSLVCRKASTTTLAPAGVSSITTSAGLHTYTVFLGSASSFFAAGNDYQVYFGNGTMTTTSVIGYVVATFSLDNRSGRVDWANTTGTATVQAGQISWGSFTGTATLNANVQNINGGGTTAAAGFVGIDWATKSGTATVQAGSIAWGTFTGTATLNANVQNVKGSGTTAAAGFVGVDWATTTGTATLNSNVQNILGAGSKGSAGYVGHDWAATTGTATIQAGSIAWGTFTGTATLNANVQYVATPAGQTIADRVLSRNIATGGDGTRTVKEALQAIRNKTTITSTGQVIVYDETDSATSWTATSTTATAVSIATIDPA